MKTREELIKLYPKNSVGAEIGVFEGGFSNLIIETAIPSTFFMVDLFTGYAVSGDKNGNNPEEVNLDVVYQKLTEKYTTNNNIKLYKGCSLDFFKSIPDNFLDFIYIDGEHSYQGVKLDINEAQKKVKPGGIISGHDYTPRFQGVIDAVDEFCLNYKLEKQLTEDGCPSFFIINKK
jgi:hypothetical protein